MTTTVKRDRWRMVLIGALAVSLLGNALTLGAVLRFRALRSEYLGPQAEAALYPRAERRAIRDALKDNAATLRPALRDLVTARTAVVAAGTARPFNRAALETAMAGFRSEVLDTLAITQGIMADALEAEARTGR